MRSVNKKETPSVAKAGALPKTTAQRLKDSEVKYRRLFEAAQDGILILNGDTGHVIDANPFIIDLLGYSREELLGKRLWEIGAFKDIDASKIAYAELQQKNYIRYNCLPLQTKNENLIDVEFVSNAYQVDGTRIIQCNIRDVTEHTKLDILMKQKGEQSEEKYRKLFESANDAILIADAETGCIVDANKKAEMLLGYSRDEILGMHQTQLHPQNRSVDYKKYFKKHVEAENIVDINSEVIRKDSSIVPVVISASVTQLNGKKLLQGIFHDVTERKQIEKSLAESERRYRTLVENANEAIIVAQDNVLKFANPKAMEMTGYSSEELSALKFIELIHPEDRAIIMKLYQKKIAGEQVVSPYDFKILTKDGSFKWVQTNSALIEWQGKPASLNFLTDITEKKSAENKLITERKFLENVTDKVGVGLAVISRDFKTVWANNVVKSLFGETEGKLCYSTYNKQPDICPWCGVKRIFENGEERVETEAHGFDKDGTEIWSQIIATSVKNENGELIGALELVIPITGRRQAENELEQSNKKLKKAVDGTIEAIALTSEIRDPYTAGHQQRVAKLASAIATEMGLPFDKIEGIRVIGILHDIGKIRVPTEILSKPGALSDAEMSLIKTHPQVGYEVLKTLELPWEICPGVLQHHERMDGSGYPFGLTGEDIVPEARIIAVADVVEAMSSYRPYRSALGIDKALEEITRNRNKLYDPNAVDACLKLFKKKGFEFE